MTGEEKEKNNTATIEINKKSLNEYILHNISDIPEKKSPSPTSPLAQESTLNRNLFPSCYNTVDSNQVAGVKL